METRVRTAAGRKNWSAPIAGEEPDLRGWGGSGRYLGRGDGRRWDNREKGWQFADVRKPRSVKGKVGPANVRQEREKERHVECRWHSFDYRVLKSTGVDADSMEVKDAVGGSFRGDWTGGEDQRE